MKKGFRLGKSERQPEVSGYFMPVFAIGLLILLVVQPVFVLFSEGGPGSLRAPLLMSLIAVVIGVVVILIIG